MEKKGFGGYFTMSVKNIYYLTGFKDISGAALSLIIPLDGTPVLLTQPLSYVAASEKAEGCVVKDVGFKGSFLGETVRELRRLKAERLGFDDLTIAMYLSLGEKLGGSMKLIHSPETVMRLRRRKDEREIQYIMRAAMLTDEGAEAGIEAVKAGIHEYEIAAEIEYAMRIHGSEGVAFETVVASGPRSALPHGLSSDRIVREGDFVTMDLGAVYSGYCCDITRTVTAGKPSSKQLQMLDTVLKAQREAFKSIRAGEKTRSVDDAARRVLEEEGFGGSFIHGLGHGVGLDIHEAPTLSPKSREVLEEGNVVSNEPGIYIQGFGGVRIEDTVWVHRDKGENLTKAAYHKR